MHDLVEVREDGRLSIDDPLMDLDLNFDLDFDLDLGLDCDCDCDCRPHQSSLKVRCSGSADEKVSKIIKHHEDITLADDRPHPLSSVQYLVSDEQVDDLGTVDGNGGLKGGQTQADERHVILCSRIRPVTGVEIH